tara:strand:- start:689 stop:1252 length:564 start_codon:yes stop_codon:yes gene_type:complete
MFDYIKIYKDIFPSETLELFQKYIKTLEFENAKIVRGKYGDNYDPNQRDTKTYGLDNLGENYSKAKWYNVIKYITKHILEIYKRDINTFDLYEEIISIEILKYNKNGHFKYHTDHCHKVPRTISISFIINNNYEGGELEFENPVTKKKLLIPNTPNTMVVFPSNFCFKHCIKPIKNGERFSVVIWAL